MDGYEGFYAGGIDHLEVTSDEFRDLIQSPFVDEVVAGDGEHFVLVVRGDVGTDIPITGSLPVVVVWVAERFGAPGPAAADLVVGEVDLAPVLAQIGQAPLAARTLALLLRATPELDVDAGLTMESAAYSMLQGGPEFAAWRAAHESQVIDDERPTVVVTRDETTLTISLDRPHRHNAISTRLRDELAAALALATVDDTIERIVLRGNGPSFCSGGDLAEFGTRPDPVTAHVTRLARSPARLVHALAAKTTARIHGATLGGGIEIAAFAGRVEAAESTTIALPEIGLGLIPGAGGTVSLTRRIGRQRTAALALSGRSIDAATALEWGLIDRIHSDPQH